MRGDNVCLCPKFKCNHAETIVFQFLAQKRFPRNASLLEQVRSEFLGSKQLFKTDLKTLKTRTLNKTNRPWTRNASTNFTTSRADRFAQQTRSNSQNLNAPNFHVINRLVRQGRPLRNGGWIRCGFDVNECISPGKGFNES